MFWAAFSFMSRLSSLRRLVLLFAVLFLLKSNTEHGVLWLINTFIKITLLLILIIIRAFIRFQLWRIQLKRKIKPFVPGRCYFSKDNGGAVLFLEKFSQEGFSARLYDLETQNFTYCSGSFHPLEVVRFIDIPVFSLRYRFKPYHPFLPVLADYINNFSRFTK